MYCKKCGALNNDDNEFCGKCGAELKAKDSVLNQRPDMIDIEPVREIERSPAQLKKHNIIAISIAAVIIIIGAIAAGAIWMNTGSRLAHKQLTLGEKYLSELKYAEAVVAFNKVIEIEPKNAEAYIGLADANIKLENFDKAEENLKKGINAIPEAENLYIKLADIFLERDYIEEAVKILEDAYAVTKSEIVKAKLDKIKADINTRGNSVGNIMNNGSVAQQGDWIYYSNFLDNHKIYKIHTDGTGRIKLNDDFSSNINVIGDWIYYCNESEKNKLYKIRTDGTSRIKLNNDESCFINVIGDWIYYSHSCCDDGNIYKIRTDGTERTKLNNDNSEYINATGNWIYYSNNSDGGKLYKIRTDGTERTKLNNDNSLYINVVEDWIYYGNLLPSDIDIILIYKIRTDGTERTKINDFSSFGINVAGDWIYYGAVDSENLYKIRTDGTKCTKLNDDCCESINVVNSWIYYKSYLDFSDFIESYKIRIDGTGRQIFK